MDGYQLSFNLDVFMYPYFIIFTISLFQFMKIEKSDHKDFGLN